MNLINYISSKFSTKSSEVPSEQPKQEAWQEVAQQRLVILRELAAEGMEAGCDYITLFYALPEVFFPIDFIASRIAKATFVVKRYKDDSVVWSRNKMLNNLARPNCVMTWSELVYTHFVYKLATGNAYLRAAMSEAFETGKKYKMCDHFWPLPADRTRPEADRTYNLPLYGICEKNELVAHYRVDTGQYNDMKIPSWQVLHERDGKVEFDVLHYMRSRSRLEAHKKPISNLIAVYAARNVIYTKRGGIGFLSSMKQDATGSVAMTATEKEQLREEINNTYGLGYNKSPFGVTDVPLQFIRTNLSISELQPFEETLEDAVKIAGAYGIPACLVPRKDNAKYDNQTGAEKSVYTGVIIPMATQFCEALTTFLGLDQDGYYLAPDFSDVDCLQDGLEAKEKVNKLINDRCLMQFNNGIITLNDWRAQIGESQIEEAEDPLFSKLKFFMTPDELERVNNIINNKTQQTSTGDERQQSGNEKEPGLSDQGE